MKRHFMFTMLSVFSILALCIGCSSGGQGFDWPAWRGPEGNGISKETGWNPEALAGGPKVLWQVDVGSGYANVVIRKNLLVTMGTKEGFTTIYGLRADTGEIVWKYPYEDNLDTQSTPAVAGDSVYALSLEGVLFCLNSRNGKLRWVKNLVKDYGAIQPVYGFAGSPVIAGDQVVLTANTSGMALNKKTGKLTWASDRPPKRFKTADPHITNGADYSTPVLFARNGKSYALIASWQGLSAVAVETGQPLWVYEWELYSGHQVTDPLMIGNRIFVALNSSLSSHPGSLLIEVLDQRPAVVWKSPSLATEISNVVAIGGQLYGGHGGPWRKEATLRCVDQETGRLLWEEVLGQAEQKQCVTLTAAGGKLIMLSDDGVLCTAEASAQAYQEFSRCVLLPGRNRRFWTPPVLCNGRIYCRNWHGELLCIDVRK